MSRKTRYKFMYRADGRYYWQAVLPVSPNDSRFEQVSCGAAWFWGRKKEASEQAT